MTAFHEEWIASFLVFSFCIALSTSAGAQGQDIEADQSKDTQTPGAGNIWTNVNSLDYSTGLDTNPSSRPDRLMSQNGFVALDTNPTSRPDRFMKQGGFVALKSKNPQSESTPTSRTIGFLSKPDGPLWQIGNSNQSSPNPTVLPTGPSPIHPDDYSFAIHPEDWPFAESNTGGKADGFTMVGMGNPLYTRGKGGMESPYFPDLYIEEKGYRDDGNGTFDYVDWNHSPSARKIMQSTQANQDQAGRLRSLHGSQTTGGPGHVQSPAGGIGGMTIGGPGQDSLKSGRDQTGEEQTDDVQQDDVPPDDYPQDDVPK